jgi:hypothetical protein
MAQLPKKATGPRPEYFEDPAIDKVLSMTLALAGEVAIMRDRIDTLERLLAKGAKVSPEIIDAYQPSIEDKQARDVWREQFLDIVMRRVHQERESLEAITATQTYDKLVEQVEKTL